MFCSLYIFHNKIHTYLPDLFRLGYLMKQIIPHSWWLNKIKTFTVHVQVHHKPDEDLCSTWSFRDQAPPIGWRRYLQNVVSEISTGQTNNGGSHQEIYLCKPDPEAHMPFSICLNEISSVGPNLTLVGMGGRAWEMWFSPVPRKRRKWML